MSKKTILIIIIIAVVLGFGYYWFFVKNGKPEYITEEVKRGTVIEEVSETGTVKVSEEVNLTFERSGKIEDIFVKTGDRVEQGEAIASLDKSELQIELSSALAVLEVAQSEYDKLLAGASEEKIKVAETAVLTARVSLASAQENLQNVRASAEESIQNAYEDALNTLESAYAEIYDTYNEVSSIQRTYFTSSDQEGIKVRSNKENIKESRDEAEDILENIQNYSERAKIDQALIDFEAVLSDVKGALVTIRNMTETINYRDVVSSTDKTTLDTQKAAINTSISSVSSAKQTISTTKLTNQQNISTAESSVSTAQTQLQSAEDELDLLTADPRDEDVSLYQAKVQQAQSSVNLLQKKITESILTAPNDGQITNVNKKVGEVVQPTSTVVSFLPSGDFQVDVDIYEEDIVRVEVGNPVIIELPAFPDREFKGKVISINPAEKVVNEVVYYEVTINFLETEKGMKPGMTADIKIEAQKKENVLVVPEDAVDDGIVKICQGGDCIEREVEIGLEGSNDLVEVISGLEEGEKVIVGEK